MKKTFDENGNKISMRDYIDTRIVALKEVISAQLVALERATSLVADNVKEKFANANEWRQQSKDREDFFAKRTEVDAEFINLKRDVTDLKKFRDNMEGKASATSVWVAIGISLIGFLVTIVLHFLK